MRRAGAAAGFGGGSARRRRVRPALQRLAAGLFAAALVAALALFVRLSQGPVALDALLPRVEAAANAQLDGARLSIERAAIALDDGPGGRPALRFEGVEIVDAEGDPLFSAPRALVALRPLDLLAGRLRPSHIDVFGARGRIRRDAEGRFALGFAGAEPEPLDEADAAAWDADFLSGVDSVRLVSAALVYDDALSGRVWTARDSLVTLRREPDGRLHAFARAQVDDGSAARTSAAVDVIGLDEGGFALNATFYDLSPPALALQFPALAPLAAVDAPAAGTIRASVDAEGGLLDLALDISLDAGAVTLGDQRLDIDYARLALGFDPDGDRFSFTALEAAAAEGRVSASGHSRLARDAEGAVAAVTTQLFLNELVVSDPALYDAPAVFERGSVTARIALAPLSVEVAELTLRRGDLTLSAEGRATRPGRGGEWSGRLSAGAAGMTVADLKALWPKPAAPGAIAWIRENMEAGRVDQVSLRAALDEGRPDLAMVFAYSDAVGHYLRPLPPIVGASGWGEIDMERFALTLAEGRVETGGAGVVSLSGSAFILPSFAEPLPPADIEVRGSGPIAAVLDVIDRPPLELVSAFGLEPSAVEGAATTVARLSVPLLKDLLLEDIVVDIESELRDLRLTPPGQDVTLASAGMALSADAAGLALAGPATIDGAPAVIDWRETFSPAPGAPRSVVDLRATLGPERLAELGLGGLGLSGGAVPVEARLEIDGATTRFDVEADLGPSAFALPAFGWAKARGAPARLTARGAAAEGVALDRFAVEAPGLRAAGAARLGPGGALRRATLDRLRIGEALDVTLDAAQEGETLRVAVGGARLDATALTLDGGGAGEGFGPVVVEIDLDALALGALGDLAAARGRASISAAGAVEARLGGALGGRAPVELAYTGPASGPGVAILRSPDAGALLREAELFADGVGGALIVEADLDISGGFALAGAARIDEIRVVDDPAIRRLVQSVDPEQARELAAGEGVRFSRISADFSLRDGVLTVLDGAAVGPTVGLTVEGVYDVEADRLDMNGVFTPAFRVNAALGGIPILGAFITGGENEGLFGVTYSVSGPSSDPRISANPLSALLPGPFRRLLGGANASQLEEGRRNLEEMRRLREMMD